MIDKRLEFFETKEIQIEKQTSINTNIDDIFNDKVIDNIDFLTPKTVLFKLEDYDIAGLKPKLKPNISSNEYMEVYGKCYEFMFNNSIMFPYDISGNTIGLKNIEIENHKECVYIVKLPSLMKCNSNVNYINNIVYTAFNIFQYYNTKNRNTFNVNDYNYIDDDKKNRNRFHEAFYGFLSSFYAKSNFKNVYSYSTYLSNFNNAICNGTIFKSCVHNIVNRMYVRKHDPNYDELWEHNDVLAIKKYEDELMKHCNQGTKKYMDFINGIDISKLTFKEITALINEYFGEDNKVDKIKKMLNRNGIYTKK